MRAAAAVLPHPVWDHYLDPAVADEVEITPLLVTLPDESLHLTAVGNTVNNARNDSPGCIQPLEGENPAGTLL